MTVNKRRAAILPSRQVDQINRGRFRRLLAGGVLELLHERDANDRVRPAAGRVHVRRCHGPVRRSLFHLRLDGLVAVDWYDLQVLD